MVLSGLRSLEFILGSYGIYLKARNDKLFNAVDILLVDILDIARKEQGVWFLANTAWTTVTDEPGVGQGSNQLYTLLHVLWTDHGNMISIPVVSDGC